MRYALVTMGLGAVALAFFFLRTRETRRGVSRPIGSSAALNASKLAQESLAVDRLPVGEVGSDDPATLMFLGRAGDPSVTPLFGPETLVQAYLDLRSRPYLNSIQAVWTADYGSDLEVGPYFEDESMWLNSNTDVTVERLINLSYIREPQLKLLKELRDEHKNLRLFSCDVENFEIYLCEYHPPSKVPQHAGILVINDPHDRKPEFGVLLDAQRNSNLEVPLRSLQRWYGTLKKAHLASDEHVPVVWDENAYVYDKFVSRESEVPWLGQFIRREDELLEDLLLSLAKGSVFLEFGSGTGRTIHYLSARDQLRTRVLYWIGFDVSLSMSRQAKRKRDDETNKHSPHRYFFDLDGSKAESYFWRGRLRHVPRMNDGKYLERRPIDQRKYTDGTKVIASLLNTTGVLDAATRESFIRSMFLAGQEQDIVVISIFVKSAFRDFAKTLYTGIRPLVGQDVVVDEKCFDYETGNFRAGSYFSHWAEESEIESLVANAGGTVREVQDIDLPSGECVGKLFVCDIDANRVQP